MSTGSVDDNGVAGVGDDLHYGSDRIAECHAELRDLITAAYPDVVRPH